MALVCTVPKYLGTVRVLHITDVYLPKLGGIEKQVAALVQIQSNSGITAQVATASAGPEIPGVFRLVGKLNFSLPLNFSAVRQVRKLLAETRPDVVHLHVGVFSQFAWFAAAAAWKSNVPVTATVHSIWGPVAKSLYRLLNLIFSWHAKVKVSAVSAAAAKPVEAVIGRPVLITPNGVDLADWQPQVLDNNPALKLVTATRLAARKRVLPLLRVIQAVSREAADVELSIAGAGVSEFILRQYVKLWRLDGKVKFIGRLSKSELQRLYSQSDLFIQLSVKEAFGLAAIEARASGLPVIGRTGNGFVEFIQSGIDGQLFASDREIAQYLLHLIKNPAELARIQANAQQPVKHGWDLTLESVNRLYQS